jgi:F0F1-type ATP synthase assembly protein I
MTSKVIRIASWTIEIIQLVAMIGLFIPWITNSPILTNPWIYIVWVLLCGVGFLLIFKWKQRKVIKKVLLIESSVLFLWLIVTALIFAATNSMP